MKKLLLMAIAAMTAFAGVQAATPYRRETGRGGFKAIERHAPVRAAAQTPVILKAAAADVETEALPFSSTLGKTDTNQSKFIGIDANNDGRTWNRAMSSYIVCQGPNTDDHQCADDWLMSPAFALKAGQDYKFSIEASGSTQEAKTADFAFFLGTGQTVADMTTTLVEKKTYAGKNFTAVEKVFTVPADGVYYIGAHCTTDKSVNTLSRLRNFKLEESAPVVDAPAAGIIEYTLRPKGEMMIDVVYTAPAKTQSGADLDKISKVEIFNWMYPNAEDKQVFANVAPGEVINTSVKAMQGQNNRIRATAYIDDNPGDLAETPNFYAGLDIPGDPLNVKATISDDFTKVTLTWDAPSEVGENGGYVDPAGVKYYIFDAFGSYYDPALAEEAASPYIFDYSAVADQDFMAYQITAGNDMGYSMGANSNVVVIGQPEPTPWHESFTDCYYGNAWMQDLKTSGRMMTGLYYDEELQTNSDAPEGTAPEYLNSHDLDNGFLFMLPYQNGDCFGLNSVKVDISAAANPVFEFYYQGKGSQLEALVAAGSAEFETVKTIDLKAAPTDDWTLCRIPLSAYKAKKYVCVGFRMTAIHNTDETTWSVPVDNFRVIDLADTDLRLSYANITPLQAGKEATVKVSVENIGTQAVALSTANLKVDDETVASATLPALEPGQVSRCSLSYTPTALAPDKVSLTCTVEAEGDAHPANNVAGPVDVDVAHSDLPAPADLAADKPGDNTVALTWTAPEFAYLTSPETVFDDFEDPEYPDFNATKVGEWTFADLDGERNCTFLKDYDNPYYGGKIGFQIFNYLKAGMPENYLEDAKPHSGNRMMVAWGSYYNGCDNWLISPELSGEAQTVKFWAHGFTTEPYESFEVRYSTTDAKPASFQLVEGSQVAAAPEDWTEYSVALPEGAKYFAIRHTTESEAWALFVDDVTYQKSSKYPADLALTGYNVYRNNTRVAQVTDRAHADTFTADGHHSYRVSAAYNYGESRACEAVDVDFTYDAAIAALTGAAVSVRGEKGSVVVTASAPAAVRLFTPDGRTIGAGTVSGTATFTAPAGVVLVATPAATYKVAVK